MDPSGLVALTSCRLIALDKCLVVRPIGIGEKAYRILGKAILAVMGGDIQETAGTQQLCAGQKQDARQLYMPRDRSLKMQIPRLYYLPSTT